MREEMHTDARDPGEFTANMPPDTEDESTEEIIYDDDMPQELTQSYGTGVHDLPGMNIGGRTMTDRREDVPLDYLMTTGGDIDSNPYQASTVGDESVGGTVNTPDMDIVDEIGAAVGLEMDDRAFLRTGEILEQRDDRRWELDPQSSEDYGVRRQERDEE
ncbi:DUF6335 family protein [Leptolyngbya ohadii]|uniref:DUF6335 family protein n=1 Tax=Leptolyngbya ohadii TaxID=1962290 RepID=UPI0021F24753|nr:DUF6335 family protein [Leptolyngbya ohadii]